MIGEHPNCQAIEDFLNQIDSVSCKIAHTQRVDNVKVPDAYTSAFWDSDGKIGFTVVAYGPGDFTLLKECGDEKSVVHGNNADAVRFGSETAQFLKWYGRK